MASTINNTQIPAISIGQNFQENLPDYLNHIENVLTHYLPNPATSQPSRLFEAMRYAVLGGGKRIRPLLVYATGSLLAVDEDYLDAAAAAIELIHVYSLIHDDLPAMDDDDLRRNKPTLHKAYDEATAILAGDALQALAFEILATIPHSDQLTIMTQRSQAIALLAKAAGAQGMVAGQVLDMEGEQQQFNEAQIETMFTLKTGMLLRAAILLPVYGDQVIEPKKISKLDDFARNIGLAFQIRDDILDVEGDTAVIGKPQGSDIERGKSTYPAILGMSLAKQRAEELYTRAMSSLDYFDGNAENLRFMADYIVRRDY